MKNLLISYGDIDYDGRLRSLISAFSQLGDLISFTRGSKAPNDLSRVTQAGYSSFIVESTGFANKIKDIDLLILDNRKATIPGMIIRHRLKPQIVVQDCRELYLFKEVKSITSKIGCLFEKQMINMADVVICANLERAQIMKNEYELRDMPIVYENLRTLQFESEKKRLDAIERFKQYLSEDEVRIITTSGCDVKRTNDILVKNLKRVKRKCHLFIAGESTPDDEETIKKLAQQDQINKITIVGKLNQSELKYLISQCHIGIVNYGKYDTNNTYCASGKLYEYLYEGIPVVTTTNPPLARICKNEGVGVSDDGYADGINEILSDYKKYLENVKHYIISNTVEKNDEQFLSSLKTRIDWKKESAKKQTSIEDISD